jgi:hypothetical protein
MMTAYQSTCIWVGWASSLNDDGNNSQNNGQHNSQYNSQHNSRHQEEEDRHSYSSSTILTPLELGISVS